MTDKLKLLVNANQARVDGQYQDAIDCYLNLLDSSVDARIMWLLALSYFGLYIEQPGSTGYGQSAIQWIDRAIALEPDRAEFYVTQGNFLAHGVDVPNYTRAADSYRVALEMTSDMVEALFGIASLEAVPEEVVGLSDAIAAMEQAAAIQPRNPYVQLRLGTLYEKAGRVSDAYSAFENALTTSEPLPISHAKSILQRLQK